MAYNNPLMVELMVPRSQETTRRIHDFFRTIGWNIWDDSRSEFDTYVAPPVTTGPAPTIAYWQTTNPGKCEKFTAYDSAKPSEYARGPRLLEVFNLVEICLLVPTDADVDTIFEHGGPVLEAHTHVPPHEHASGRQEFRFTDPFNYALRVTANPGYEVNEDRVY